MASNCTRPPRCHAEKWLSAFVRRVWRGRVLFSADVFRASAGTNHRSASVSRFGADGHHSIPSVYRRSAEIYLRGRLFETLKRALAGSVRMFPTPKRELVARLRIFQISKRATVLIQPLRQAVRVRKLGLTARGPLGSLRAIALNIPLHFDVIIRENAGIARWVLLERFATVNFSFAGANELHLILRPFARA